VNIIIRYVPLLSRVLWIRIEFLISSNLPAKDFMTRIYNDLVRMGAEVAIKKDSISAIFRVNMNSISEDINRLLSSLKGILGCNALELSYLGYEVVNIG